MRALDAVNRHLPAHLLHPRRVDGRDGRVGGVEVLRSLEERKEVGAGREAEVLELGLEHAVEAVAQQADLLALAREP